MWLAVWSAFFERDSILQLTFGTLCPVLSDSCILPERPSVGLGCFIAPLDVLFDPLCSESSPAYELASEFVASLDVLDSLSNSGRDDSWVGFEVKPTSCEEKGEVNSVSTVELDTLLADFINGGT